MYRPGTMLFDFSFIVTATILSQNMAVALSTINPSSEITAGSHFQLVEARNREIYFVWSRQGYAYMFETVTYKYIYRDQAMLT